MDRRTGPSLDTVIIYTTRMAELAAFYGDGLELPAYEAEGTRHLGCKVGEVYFGFDQGDEASGQPPSAVTVWFTVDDLQRTFERFVGLGAQVVARPAKKPWGARIAAVLDPDGNRVGLAQRR